MENWPNIPLPSACPSGIRDPLLEDEFQSGDDAARPQFAAPRCLPITLSWNWMHKTHLATLRTFQKAHRADLFLWEDPFTGEQWEARFAGEEPVKWSPIAKLPDYAQVTATIKPVNEVILPADAPVTKRKPSYILSAEIGLSSEVVERTSEQTYRREDGSLGVMPANTLVPSVKNGRKCFEIYGWRQNLYASPANFADSSWYRARSSVVSQEGLQKLAANGATDGSHYIQQEITVEPEKEYSISFVVEQAEVETFRLRTVLTESPFTAVGGVFDFTTGGVIPQGDVIATGMEQLAEGRWLCWITIQIPLGVTSIWGRLTLGKTNAIGSGNGIYLLSSQFEKGNVPSPHIVNGQYRPRTAVTTPAESWFNTNEGTFIVEFIQNNNQLYSNYIRLGKWSQEPALILVKTTDGDTVYVHYGAKSDAKAIKSSVRIENILSRIAISYKFNEILKISVNGETPRSTSLVGVTKVTSTNLEYFISGAEGDLIDCIYYPEAVTDEELQAFSEVRHA